MTGSVLTTITIFNSPLDQPGKFVVREFFIGEGGVVVPAVDAIAIVDTSRKPAPLYLQDSTASRACSVITPPWWRDVPVITSRDRKVLSRMLSTPWRAVTVTADGPLVTAIEAIVEREVQRRFAPTLRQLRVILDETDHQMNPDVAERLWRLLDAPPKDTFFCKRCDEDHERDLYLAHKDV